MIKVMQDLMLVKSLLQEASYLNILIQEKIRLLKMPKKDCQRDFLKYPRGQVLGIT